MRQPGACYTFIAQLRRGKVKRACVRRLHTNGSGRENTGTAVRGRQCSVAKQAVSAGWGSVW